MGITTHKMMFLTAMFCVQASGKNLAKTELAG